MIAVLAAAALGFLPATAATQDTISGAVHGRVISAATGTPLAGAAVELRRSGTYRLALTDDQGRYRFARLVPGPTRIVARSLDHAALEAGVVVPANGDVTLDLTLEVRPLLLPPLHASVAGPANFLAAPSISEGELRRAGETELRALDSTPGVSEMGLGGSGQPPDPGDPSSVLYVRGAAADLKLVLLDGAPVYAPFHLSGLMDAFPEGTLERAKLYIGGTPARFDGGLSYVLDLELRGGDEEALRTAGTVDLLGATARAEGPLGEAGRVLAGGRWLHGAGFPALTGGEEMPYGYGDALGRVDLDLGGSHVTATGFWNRESVDLAPVQVGGGDPPKSAYWGNTAGSVRYRGELGPGTVALTAAHGRFRTQLPIQGQTFTVADGRTRRTRLLASYETEAPRLRWNAGTALDLYHTELEQSTVAGDSTVLQSAGGEVFAGYAEAGWLATPTLELRAGLRADYFRPDDEARLAPRASVRWRVAERATLTLAAGRFHQFVRGPESILSADLTGPTLGPIDAPRLDDGTDSLAAVDAGSLFAVAGATHLVVGLENELEAGLALGIEGYFKAFDGLPSAERLRASGADLWIHQEEGPVRGWVGYSLGWVWTDDPGEDRRFVGRHLLSGGIESEVRGFDLGFRVTYGAGLPFSTVRTSVPDSPAFGASGDPSSQEEDPAPALSGALDDSYLRLDAEVSRRWELGVGERRIEIAPYLRLLNALDRRDALFYRADGEGPGRPAPLASVPILAVFGVAWSF